MAFWNSKESFTQNQMSEAVAAAVEETIKVAEFAYVNSNDAKTFRAQMATAQSGGYDFADTLHNIYYDYGYPASLDFFNFWNMYRRFGIAKAVVEYPVNTCWSTNPTIDAAGIEGDIEKLENDFGLWRRCKALDTRQRVGRYAGLFMRVKDGKKPNEPIEGKLSGLASLVDMMPLYESQLDVVSTDQDPLSERYGQPIIYQFNGSAEGDGNENESGSFEIHHSRIVTVAEGSDNGSIYGVSALEAVYNSLMDLRKIVGAGGEGFYKNASQSMVFSTGDSQAWVNNKARLDEFAEQTNDFMRNRFRRALVTPMDAKTLDSNLANPRDHFFDALYDVSAGSGIPSNLLIGSQTGVLAGDNDGKQFLSSQNSRRTDFCTELVEAVIDWMMTFGILKTQTYKVVWDDLLAAGDSEKLDNAFKMADINTKQFLSGGGSVFDGEEIREAAGFEAEDLPEPSETIEEED